MFCYLLLMRQLLAVLLVLAACGSPSSPQTESADDGRRSLRTAPLTDLQFNDEQLRAIAEDLTRDARARGIDATPPGRNRIERLLRLEAALGTSTRAMDRVDALVLRVTATDATQWSEIRQRAAREFSRGDSEAGRRVTALLMRWQREKADAAASYLSSNYTTTFIPSIEWERRFHDFVATRPADAATWGWLLLRNDPAVVKQQYGRADAESAYEFYLEFSGLGDRREARRLFSVPGIEITSPPRP